MAKNQNKTQPDDTNVVGFLQAIEHEGKREDAQKLLEIYRRITGLEPVLWGGSMIGFGQYHYRSDSGREGDFFRAGFAPRKANFSIYLMAAYCDADTQAKNDALLEKLGAYKMGKGCLYITRLARVDLGVLEALIALNFAEMNRLYPN